MAIRARVLDATVVATAIAAVVLMAQRTCAHGSDRVLGVALGMSAADLRSAFASGVAGRFRASAGATRPWLEWRADVERSGAPAAAELELHDGKLARIRLHFGRTTARRDVRRLLGARTLEDATVSRERDGSLVATWDARCDGEAR